MPTVCPNCGEPITESKKFCINCGAKIEIKAEPEPEPEPQPKPEPEPEPTPEPKPGTPKIQLQLEHDFDSFDVPDNSNAPEPEPPPKPPEQPEPPPFIPPPPPATPVFSGGPPAPPVTQAQNADADAAPPKGSKYTPTGTLAYMGLMILFNLPIIGLITSIILACGKNVNRKNYGKAVLIFKIIGYVIAIGCAVTLWVIWIRVMELLTDYIPGLDFDSIFSSIY